VDGLERLAWVMPSKRVFVPPPRVRPVFFLGLPMVVSVGKEPLSNLLFIRYARFLPPEVFFLCRFPCQADKLVGLPFWSCQGTTRNLAYKFIGFE